MANSGWLERILATACPEHGPGDACYDPTLNMELPGPPLYCGARIRAAEASAPVGLGGLAERLAELAALPANWDSYGSRQIDPRAIEAARKTLAAKPRVFPVPGGGVQIEWGDGAEVEFLPDGEQRFDPPLPTPASPEGPRGNVTQRVIDALGGETPVGATCKPWCGTIAQAGEGANRIGAFSTDPSRPRGGDAGDAPHPFLDYCTRGCWERAHRGGTGHSPVGGGR